MLFPTLWHRKRCNGMHEGWGGHVVLLVGATLSSFVNIIKIFITHRRHRPTRARTKSELRLLYQLVKPSHQLSAVSHRQLIKAHILLPLAQYPIIRSPSLRARLLQHPQITPRRHLSLTNLINSVNQSSMDGTVVSTKRKGQLSPSPSRPPRQSTHSHTEKLRRATAD